MSYGEMLVDEKNPTVLLNFLLNKLTFHFLVWSTGPRTHPHLCVQVCVCVCCACLCVACLPVSLRLNKGVFCISVLSPPSSPLTFYCELLGDWQKRSAVQPFIYLPLPPPPCVHPSLIHPPVYLHLSNPLPPRVALSLSLFPSDIKHALTVF